LSWLGHQSRFDLPPTLVCITGHLPAVPTSFPSMFFSE
jgi:hypothetical protein